MQPENWTDPEKKQLALTYKLNRQQTSFPLTKKHKTKIFLHIIATQDLVKTDKADKAAQISCIIY